MKRVSKLFVLVLTLSLLCGVVFAVMSSAADETPRYWYTEDISESVTGATRKHRDFTGESFDSHQILDGKNVPSPKTTEGPQNLWATTQKNGHILSVTDPSGNTYIEYASRVDRNDGATGNDDAVVGLHPNSSIAVNGLSYITCEFDMMTPTDFPAEIKIFLETRLHGASGEHVFADGAKPRIRKTFATYSKSNGTWNFGAGTLSLEAGEWAHVSLVFQINKTVNNDGTVSFHDSVAKAYVNGQYMGTISEFFSAEYLATDDISARIHYCGVGYAYGNSLAGTKADDAVALDNMVFTTYTPEYVADAENAKLAKLFGDDPVTDITDLGAEIVWTKDYELPEYSGDVEVIDEFGTIYGAEPEYGEVTSVKSALAFIRDNELAKATLKLYGSQYNPLYIDFPVELTIDFNGYQLKNGYEVPDHLYVEFNAETSTLTVSADPTKLVTINYYDVPKDFADADAVITQVLAQGRDLAFRIGEITPRELTTDSNIYIPLATYKVYDEQGTEVDPAIFTTNVTEEIIGKTYSV
ncbi:MAG: hypothetical protein IJW69_01710, partial [Clostridia bacterium]|nr:hypothetical protein [Clostridia bacterium]